MMLVESGLPTLATIAGRIARREVSPVEVTEEVLARIARLEPQLNAFITVMGETALEAARVAEAEIAGGHYRGPLHGVPLSLKDLFNTRGVRTTGASRILADNIPDHDATVVRKLAEAGAVVVGKTNMLEFAYGEVSQHFGPTRNPWNPDYSTSGSSSGSGAAVAAGLGYGSLGSDTGGSIRAPAFWCGIVGLKPTYGLVSRAGVLPLSWSLDHVGPMTRTVRDCALLLEAIAGHDPADPSSARVPIPRYGDLLDQPPGPVTIGVVEPVDGDLVTAEVHGAVATAAATLRQRGFVTKSVALPHPLQTPRSLLGIMYAEASEYHLPWLRTSADQYSPNTRERLELGTLLPGTVYVRAQRARRIIIAAYRALFQEVDLLLTPVIPSVASRIDEPVGAPVRAGGDRLGALTRFTCPFNLIGNPAIAVPTGLTDAGLPNGVQLVARPFAEPLLLQVAQALEEGLQA